MSDMWATRQRQTNKVARKLAYWLFQQNSITPQQIYGLAKLAWITTGNYTNTDSSYINSTKIPALADILGETLPTDLPRACRRVATVLGDNSLYDDLQQHTGFTNFYNAYRNTAANWTTDHFGDLLDITRLAYSAQTPVQHLDIIDRIRDLPGIPHPTLGHRCAPENFLSPLCFMLDPQCRFPIINGNQFVRQMLRKLRANQASLQDQYRALVSLYGQNGIQDAADIDMAGRDLADFVNIEGQEAKRALLTAKPVEGNELPLKDAQDVNAIRDTGEHWQRRLHNQITNRLKHVFPQFTLQEGNSQQCRFDVLLRGYGKLDLLIEVKSSVDMASVRMAVGQLFSYWYALNPDQDIELVVVLPEKPEQSVQDYLDWMKIGLLWLENGYFSTLTERLVGLCGVQNRECPET